VCVQVPCVCLLYAASSMTERNSTEGMNCTVHEGGNLDFVAGVKHLPTHSKIFQEPGAETHQTVCSTVRKNQWQSDLLFHIYNLTAVIEKN
jgi:hypothetical protein